MKKRGKSNQINAIRASMKDGARSPTIVATQGCDPCPWKRTCPMYEKGHRVGCEARRQYLLETRKELGNVELNLFKRATVLREELDAEAEHIRSRGESPINNKNWMAGNKLDLELAKYLVQIKHGTKQHIHVHKEIDDEGIINITPDDDGRD